MSQIRFLYDDLGQPATLTASTENTAFPKENIVNELRTKIWKSTDLTSETLDFDLGAASAVDTIAIMNHNFSDFTSVTPTITWIGDDDSGFGSPSTSEALTVVSGIIILYFSSDSKRYWRLSITGGSGTETVYEVGRVMFGARLQPTKTFDIGFERSIMDFTTMSQSIGGQLHSDFKDKFDVVRVNFSHQSKTDRDSIITMAENNRTAKNLIVTLDTASTATINDTTYYGKLVGLPAFTNSLKTANDERYNTALEIRESL